MKKLLVAAIGAAAAIGAFADDPYINAVRLTGSGEKDIAGLNAAATINTQSGTYFAASLDSAGTNQYSVVEKSGDLPTTCPLQNGVFSSPMTTALSVKTQFGKPLEFYVVPSNENTSVEKEIGAGLYFDSLVKFTVCDGDLEQNYADAKIVMWLQTNEAETQTNLMVKAGYLSVDGGDVVATPTIYTCDNVIDGDFADKWHRVTIKAIADITASKAGVPAFAIYIDGNETGIGMKEVGTSEAKWDSNSFTYSLTDAAKYLNDNGKLFPSLKQGDVTGKDSLSCVAFDGTGWLNDLVVTDQLPGEFAKDHEANKATVVISGKTTTFESIAEAIEEINAIKHSGATASLSLMKSMTLTEPITFTGAGATTITLDFAGFVLTNNSEFAAITNSAASLTITNSVGNGGIYCTKRLVDEYEDWGMALYNTATLTIQGGNFWGYIVTETATVSVTGGGFASIDDVYAYIAPGKKYSQSGDLYIISDKESYTVTYDTAGGLPVIDSQSVMEGEKAPVPETVLTKTGYTFAGWSPDIAATTITGPTTFTAQWTINTYLVTFMNGEDTFATTNVEYNTVAVAPAPAPTKTGYTFNYWYTSDSAVAYDFDTPVTDVLTLNAKFTADTYTVTYNLDLVGATNAVNNIASYTIETAEFTLLDAGCEGYTFNGWTNTSGTVTAIAGGTTGDVTLYAQWTQQSSDPIPPVSPEADSATVNAAVDEAGFTDSAVKALINGDATKYNNFKSWADSVSGGEKAVVGSAHAAVSFQLSPIVQSATLFENTPVLKFTKIEPTASSTSWDVTVELKDGEDKTVQLKAAAADFATRVWKGSSLSNMTQCSASDVTAAVQDADGKKVTLTVTPPSGTSGFIKIKAE